MGGTHIVKTNELEFTTKRCSRCKEEKHVTEFYEHKNNKKHGLYPYCKSCCKKDNDNNYSKTKDTAARKETSRRSHLLRTYGITLEQYNELLAKQDHCCVICSKHESEFKQKLAVDHNHITGEIRGLLCGYCNHRVIGRHRDGDLLRKMADYVDQGTGWFVPKKKRPVKRKPK